MKARFRFLFLLFSVLMLVLVRAQDSDDGGERARGRWKIARKKSSYPTLAMTHSLLQSEEERAQPCLIALPGDRALLVFVSYRIGASDQLVAQEVRQDGVDEPEVIRAEPAQILRPCGALNADGLPQVFWAELEQGTPRLFTAVRGADGWSAAERLNTGKGQSYNAECTRAADGTLWLCWQEFRRPDPKLRGSFDVLLARVDNATLSQPVAVSDARFSDWDPVVCAGIDGKIWTAWVLYGGRDYEIWMRSFDPAESVLSGPMNVSRDPISDDLHPAIACAPDGTVWLAWDRICDLRRGASERRVEDALLRGEVTSLHVACWRQGALELPRGDKETPGVLAEEALLSWSGGLPKIAVDSQGFVHVVHRYLDEEGDNAPRHSYPVLTQSFDGESWSKPHLFHGSEGDQEEPALCCGEAGFWVAFQRDRRQFERETGLIELPPLEMQKLLQSHGWYLSGRIGPSHLGVAQFHVPADWTRKPLVTTKAPERSAELRPHPLHDSDSDPIILGDEHLFVEHGDKKYQVYWGDLHRHSSVSRCLYGIEQRASDRYDFGRDVNLYDFFALTDHSSHMDPFQWWSLSKLVDFYRTPTLCTLQGFEWSTSDFGHQNVIFRRRTDFVISSRLVKDPNELWNLLPENDAITIPHHTAHARMPTDWSYADPRFMKVVEVFQADRGNFEFDGCFRQAPSAGAVGSFVQDGLQRGLCFGLIASSDHGNGASYAAVLATELNADSVFDALSARRCYGSTTKGMLVDFRIDGHRAAIIAAT